MSVIAKLLRSKAFVVTLIVLPGLWPAWPILRHNPTVLADPIKYVLHHLGFTACILLAIVLCLTPLRVLFPRWSIAQALNRHRRLVGVSTFVYAILHFTTHLLYETGGDVSSLKLVWHNILTKPFQLVGLITLSILLILAATSFNAAIRGLGSHRWKNLHRLVYLAAPLAAYHQADARKIFPMQVVWIFGPVLVLEIARIVRQRQKAAPSVKSA